MRIATGAVAAALLAAGIAPALANNIIAGVRVDPAAAAAGTSVAIAITTADNNLPASCGLRIEYGDGTVEDFAATGRDGIFPRTFNRVYIQPGNYTVRVSGRPFGEFLPCGGGAAAELRISAAAAATPVVPAGAAQSTPAASTQPVPRARAVVQEYSLCPAGWALSGETARDGSFTCVQQKPARLACPQGLVFFEKAGTMGCRAPARR